MIACVASVSNQVTERKLEREQKKGPFFFFYSGPNFLDEHARKRLLRRLSKWQKLFYVEMKTEG